ncbi:MAG: YHS domain-containing protein [Nitrososphaeraceae archaeon]
MALNKVEIDSAIRMILLMPVDPVCGIELEEEMAVSLIHNGKSYFFCCEGCKGIFIRKPKKYARNRSI